MSTSKSWSKDDIAAVAKMIREGLTFERIGAVFGVSKNAAIGIVKRTPELEDLNRGRELKRRVPLTKEEKQRKAVECSRQHRAVQAEKKAAANVLKKVEPTKQAEKSTSPIQLPVKRRAELQTAGRPLSVLNAFECRWAVNDADRGQEHLFCGSRNEIGSRYCSYHAAKAFGKGTFGERTALHVLKKHAA